MMKLSFYDHATTASEDSMSEPHDDTAMRVQILRNSFAPTACYLSEGEAHTIRHEVTVSIDNEIAHALNEADRGNMEPLRAITEAATRRLSALMIKQMGYEIVDVPDPPLHPDWHPSHREIL